MSDYKTSLLVNRQVPEFVREEYPLFITFLEAYYEWLQLSHTANSLNTVVNSSGQGITHASQNLLSYVDVDSTIDDFIQYFINDFLPYIPADALVDKRRLLKISKEFYQSKGTEKSYKFLFRALYGINAELFETGDVVLKASAGKWIVPKSIRINSSDTNWLLTKGLIIFGETSKSFATIDYALFNGSKTELYISNIKRTFESGEYVKIVDNNYKDVYFYNNEILYNVLMEKHSTIYANNIECETLNPKHPIAWIFSRLNNLSEENKIKMEQNLNDSEMFNKFHEFSLKIE